MSDYQARISGPLMDRIDIRIDVVAVSASDLIRLMLAEKSADIALRVAVARTLADLDDKQMVGRINPAEAISYRNAGERLNAAA
jgi:predicted ATPase with chaperone activity